MAIKDIFNEIYIKMQHFSFNEIHLKTVYAKHWRLCCGLNIKDEYEIFIVFLSIVVQPAKMEQTPNANWQKMLILYRWINVIK